MRKPTAYQLRSGTSPRWCFAFASGCGGRNVEPGGKLFPGPISVFGEPRSVLLQAISEGRDWYYGDHGYFGRGMYYRVTRNAYQHDGHGDAGPDRFNVFGLRIRSWRKSGQFVLVCPPDEVFAGLMGFDADSWTEHIVDRIQSETHLGIKVRARRASTPLKSVLEGCWALVTYTSNAAVEAALLGVPVFCLGRCAASAIGLSDLSMIDQPIYPPRAQWAWNLAANQWTLDEISRGDCWRAIGR